ncbi:MAG: DNA gyrase C-terminal beta-propeller domain-containing protein, partial [Thiomonas sp.]
LALDSLSFKPGDALYATFECRSVDPLVVFGSDGRVYSLAVADLPGGRGDGQPITAFIELAPGTQALHYVAGARGTQLLLWTAQGFGFLTTLGDCLSRQRAGKTFVTLEGGDSLQRPLPLLTADGGDGPTGRLALLSAQGRLLIYAAAEVKTLARGGRGVTLMALDAAESLVSIAHLASERDALLLTGKGRGGADRSTTLSAAQQAVYAGKRARRGRQLDLTYKPDRASRAA